MWSWPDGKCRITNSVMAGAKKQYRYPKGVSPGDVVQRIDKGGTSSKPVTTMDRVIYEIFPFAMGILIVLLLMSTISYLCFSVLRLFYLDTLKPYKVKKLKGLGKHRHYYNTGDDEKKKLAKNKFRKLRPTINTLDLEEYVAHTGRNFPQRSLKDTLVHPPGKKISYTSPPLNTMEGKGAPAKGYPHVMDLLQAGDLDEVSRFPSQTSKMYKGGIGAPSRIPIPIDKQRGLETRKDENQPRPHSPYKFKGPPPTEERQAPREPPILIGGIRKVYTKIPKIEKKTYKQQLRILRGGPRRDSEEIRDLIWSLKNENKPREN